MLRFGGKVLLGVMDRTLLVTSKLTMYVILATVMTINELGKKRRKRNVATRFRAE